MHIPPKLKEACIELKVLYNNCKLTCCDSAKYLGIIIDSKLNFQVHLNMIESKVARSIGILSKVCFLSPSSTLLLLYFALIHLHLLFGITSISYLTKLQRLQNKAIRIISNCNYFSSITPQYYKLGILKITDLYKFETAKLMHQHSKQFLPLQISTLFKPLSSVHNCQTRFKTHNNLYVQKYSTSRCQKSIRFRK